MIAKTPHRKRTKQGHHYSSDQPIHFRKDDILGRAKFAAHLANDIHKWEGKDSLVIALYGAWGSGKTSIKNLVLEANKKPSKPIPILEFNPWRLSGTGSIPATFFRDLSIALGDQGPKSEVKGRAEKLNAYAANFKLFGSTLDSVGLAASVLNPALGLAVKSVGTGMKSVAGVLKEGGEAATATREAKLKSLEDQKRELADLLTQLPRPILVIIDDIDRLTTEEIRQVFQLVKANADFPRIIYLLLFEREIVAKALDQISGDKGMEFLEKIVQVGYHVPHASQAAVHSALFSGLDGLPEVPSASKQWNRNRWRNIFSDGISGYFKNLRHVNRYLASLTFHVQQHRTGNSMEVNIIDLIGLETLRVFEPSVFERLPGAKRILTRYKGPGIPGQIKQDVIDQGLAQIISGVPTENKSRVETILKALFPPLSSAYSSTNDGVPTVLNEHEEWLRDLRVCHPSLFDKYFTLSIAADDLSQAELDNLLAHTADANLFVAACDALEGRGLLKIAFERLDAYRKQIPVEHVPTLIKALCDMGDRFPTKEPGLFMVDLETIAARLIFFGLKREPNPIKRFEILLNAISLSAGLSLPVRIVSAQERVANREERGYEFLVQEDNLPAIKNLCVEKLRAAAQGVAFFDNPRFQMLIWRWSEWASIEEVRTWVAGRIQTTADAVAVLTALLNEMSTHGRDHRIYYYIHLPTLERFSDLPTLATLLAPAENTKLPKRETIALREYKKALKRRAEGKPDNDWENTHDDPDGEIVG